MPMDMIRAIKKEVTQDTATDTTKDIAGGKRAGTVSGEDTGYSKGYDEGYTQGYYVGFSDAAGATADPVYITLSGTKYHRAGCSYLNDSAVMTSRSAAIADGYTACSRCNP